MPPPNLSSPSSSQDASDPELKRGARDDRSRSSTNVVGKRQSQSNSIPPNSRLTHDNNLQQNEESRTQAQDLKPERITRNVEVNVQVQISSQIQVGERHGATQSTVKSGPRSRRNSVTYPPVLAPGRMSTSSLVDRPVIPGITTNVAHVSNRSRKNSCQRPRILFYHKHEPYYGFTNFSAHPVMYEGKMYSTSEHLFQSFKFTHRPGLAEHIRKCSPMPSVAFSEARRFAQEVRPDWSRENINAMNIVIYQKFTQHKDLKRELLATGNAELIENSDKDAFWGCGADGRGRNELGKALERLRTQLREER